MKVRDKVIVVTGGGSGMGRELVLGLLGKGARVAAIDINADNLAETASLSGDKAASLATFVVDVTDRKAVEELPEKVIGRFHDVDGVINNAGIIQPFVKVNDLGYPTIERVLNVNLYGTIYMTKTFQPHLLGRSEAHIVNISSMGGFVPVPGQALYGASKAAVKLLTEGLASELAGTGVRVTVVFPGAVSTNITVNSGVKGFELPADQQQQRIKILSAAAAAQIIIDGIERDRPRVLVGSDAKFMDFFSRLNTVGAGRMIQKRMGALLKS